MDVNNLDWNSEKNDQLLAERGINFFDVLIAIRENKIFDDFTNPNATKYPHQRIMVVEINGYTCLVPYVETEKGIFLKTIIPSRKATKKYLGKGKII